MTTYRIQAGDRAESLAVETDADKAKLYTAAQRLAKHTGRDAEIFADGETKPRLTVAVPARTLHLRQEEHDDQGAARRIPAHRERHFVRTPTQLRSVAERATDMARSTGRPVYVHDETADGAPLFEVKANDKGAIEVRSVFSDDELDVGARDFKKHATERVTLREWTRSFFGGSATG